MTNEKMLRRLEWLKELKAEYYIGSQDAHRFIKAMGHYEELLNAHKQEFLGLGFTLRDVAKLHSKMLSATLWFLESIIYQYSTVNDLSVGSIIDVGWPTRDAAYSPEIRKNREEWGFWSVDANLFFSCYLSFVLKTAQILRVSKESIIDSTAIFQFFRSTRNVPFFVWSKDGRRFSAQDIIDNPNLRKCEATQFWKHCEIRTRRLRRPGKKAFETELERLLVGVQRRSREDLLVCHEILKKLKLASVNTMLSYPQWKGEYTIEEQSYLLDAESLYERAEREHTLGCLDVERRIAISYLVRFEVVDAKQSVEKIVAEAIDAARKNVPSQEHVAVVESVPRGRFYRYIYLALYQNRKWLIDFLSR